LLVIGAVSIWLAAMLLVVALCSAARRGDSPASRVPKPAGERRVIVADRHGRTRTAAVVTPLLLAAAFVMAVDHTAPPADASAKPPSVRVPDDVRFKQQWQFARSNVMGAQRAWSLGRGGAATVAIVDTGMDLDHPDLQANLWTNPREVPGNGVDDDGDGHVDDVHGWDFANNDADPSDDNGHGTHVAGIVAARGDNGIGVTGVAWRARIMPVKAVDQNASGTSSAVAEGIRYAAAHGARIVLLALAGSEPGAFLEDAVRAASDAGVLVVCAAGNGGRDDDVQPAFPASFAYPNVISVAATRRDGSLSPLSNYGRTTVDIAASGEGILSTAMGAGYERRSGTSMAAATVAGALALMSSSGPDLTADQLRDTLLGTARRGSLPIAGGSLDLAAAMRRVQELSR
jgi:subtilisin family serine protease